jgi:hypothetical protein
MAITVFIDVIDRDGLSPGSTALELDVLGIDAGVNNIYIDTVTTVRIVNIPGEGTKTELLSVADTRKTLQWTIVTWLRFTI